MRRTLLVLIACAAFLCGCAEGSKTSDSKADDEATTSQSEKWSSKQSSSHEHAYSAKWSSDETYHWHECTCGHNVIKDKASHTFSKWAVDVQPTEEEEGEKHRLCTVCSYKETLSMAKVEHEHTWGEASYTWALDYSSCTAKHSCTKNLYHEEKETANSVYEVISEPTTSSAGRGCYTATFANSSFLTQTAYVSIPKLNVPATGISLSKDSVEVSKGSYAYVYATVAPSNATNKNVIWSSSDESVATAEDGVIKGVDEGTAIITAIAEDGGYSATCSVTVTYIPVTGVSLSDESILLEIGEESSTIYAHVAPSNASITDVTWSIGDSSVASFETTLFSGAKVKGVSTGETTLAATTSDGGFVSSCKIKVIEKKNVSYEVGDVSLRIYQYNSTNYVFASVPVTNNGNVDIYVSSSGLNIEDSGGSLKQSISSYSVDIYLDIIRPGETTYAYVDVEYTGDTTTGLVGLFSLAVKDASSADGIRYEVSEDITFAQRKYGNGFEATGKVANNTEKSTSLVYIVVFVFDEYGDYYCTLRASVSDDLAPDASATFTASNSSLYRHGNEFTVDDIGSYKAYAYEFEIFF